MKNNKEIKEYKMCDGCPACCPEDYCIEINMGDLIMIQRALINLRNHANYYSADGWLERVENIMRECIKKYNLKEEDFDMFHNKFLLTNQ